MIKFKKYIACALAVTLTLGALPIGSYAQTSAQHEGVQPIDYYLEQNIPIISEYEFLELKEDKIILEEISVDDYTTLIHYESKNDNGYLEIEPQSVVVFKIVTMKTFAALKNSNVMGRLSQGGLLSSVDWNAANKHTTAIRSAVRGSANRAHVRDQIVGRLHGTQGLNLSQARRIAFALLING